MEPQSASDDMLSALPSSIIEAILCLLPIREAARTSILSKEWRYIWTKIPKLEFYDFLSDESTDHKSLPSISGLTLASKRKWMSKRCKLLHDIHKVLRMRQAPIYEFTFSFMLDKTCVEFDHIISYLSKYHTVEKLKLDLKRCSHTYLLPASFFSLHHLTEVHLKDCNLNLPPTFNGFSRLTSLHWVNVQASIKALLHFLSSSQLLRSFTLILGANNLVKDENSAINELLECLPAVEHLSIEGSIVEYFDVDSVPQKLPASPIHLKDLHLDFFGYNLNDELRLLALIIRCSPNLEKITLGFCWGFMGFEHESVQEAYSDIWLDHLNELKIYGMLNWDLESMKSELEFVKFMLAKSPKLKKVDLCFDNAKNQESEILRILLHSPPASAVVEINVRSGLPGTSLHSSGLLWSR